MTVSSGTIAALDLGTARIGVAIADMQVRLAHPVDTLRNDDSLVQHLREFCDQEHVTQLVIGLPGVLKDKRLLKQKPPKLWVKFGEQLKLPVNWQDEALTSAQAEAELKARANRIQKKLSTLYQRPTYWRIIYVPKYSLDRKFHRLPQRVWIILTVLVVLIIVGTVAVQRVYYDNLQPVSNSTKIQYITVASGLGLNQIANQLHAAGLIRSSQVFEWYVSIHNDRDALQAGTYGFSPSQSTSEIAKAIADGKVATNLVTILSGQSLSQFSNLIKAGFSPARLRQL